MAATASNRIVLHSYDATGCVSAGAAAEEAAWKLRSACRSEIPELSGRRFGSWALGLVRPLAVVLVLGSAAAAAASEPERSGAAHLLGIETIGWTREVLASIESDGLIAAWAAVFAALYLLYAYERARGLGRKLASDAAVARWLIALRGAVAPAARRSAAKPALASSRPLFASPSKAEAGGERPARQAAGRGRVGQAKAREKATPVGEMIGLGATQSGEETFSVAEATSADASAAPATAPLGPPAPAAASGASLVSTPASTAGVDRPDCVQLCATLRSQGRFAEAERLARAGLAVAGDPGLLLVELSRAEFGLGRVNAAIDTARDAYFASPSRESVLHLIRLLTETRSFTRDDGPSLRRAASRHPRQPLLLQAAGVFESMYGRPCDAERWLRAALTLAPDEKEHRAIARDLSRVEESRAREV